MKKQEWNKEFEPNEIDLEEIAHAITEECTSGRLDCEGRYIYWELKMNTWTKEEGK